MISRQVQKPTRIAVMLGCVLLVSATVLAQNSSQSKNTERPDLSGYWGFLVGDGAQEGGGKADIQFAFGDGHLNGTVEQFQRWLTHFEKDIQVTIRGIENRPVYRPEYWEKIRHADWDHSRKKDPASHCLPAVPRLGAPQRIVQLSNEVIFFYEGLNRFRFIPTDGRSHDPVRVSIPSWFGEPVGRWEGSTLVIETRGIIDAAWIGWSAFSHSDDMKVIERVSLDKDKNLRIETTVEDPMLLQPWQMEPIVTKRNPNPKAQLWEESPCEERDQEFTGDPFEGH